MGAFGCRARRVGGPPRPPPLLVQVPPARWVWGTSQDYSADGDALGDAAAPDSGVGGVRHDGIIGSRARLAVLVPMPHVRWRERECWVQMCSAVTGTGVADGLEWLVASLKRTLG